MSLISHFGDIYQLGYVARDLDKATGFLSSKFGVQEFVTRNSELTVTVNGEARPLQMRVAIANIGNKQIEVIQPVSGATEIYTDRIDFDRSAVIFHHVGIVVRGAIDNWAAMERNVRSADDDFALSFAADNGADPIVRFAYVDTRASLGHYTEFLWWAAGMAAVNPTLPNLAA